MAGYLPRFLTLTLKKNEHCEKYSAILTSRLVNNRDTYSSIDYNGIFVNSCGFFHRWNIIDLVIVILSLAGILVESLSSTRRLLINPTVARSLRVLRIIRGMFPKTIMRTVFSPNFKSFIRTGGYQKT